MKDTSIIDALKKEKRDLFKHEDVLLEEVRRVLVTDKFSEKNILNNLKTVVELGPGSKDALNKKTVPFISAGKMYPQGQSRLPSFLLTTMRFPFAASRGFTGR